MYYGFDFDTYRRLVFHRFPVYLIWIMTRYFRSSSKDGQETKKPLALLTPVITPCRGRNSPSFQVSRTNSSVGFSSYGTVD